MSCVTFPIAVLMLSRNSGSVFGIGGTSDVIGDVAVVGSVALVLLCYNVGFSVPTLQNSFKWMPLLPHKIYGIFLGHSCRIFVT
jgi:hypothetical protein